MESPKDKVELIQQAIKQLMEDEKHNSVSPSSDDCEVDRRLLCKLLSQLETIKGDDKIQQPAQSVDEILLPAPAVDRIEPENETTSEADGASKPGIDEIIKELRNVKRQNLITHVLVSAMIVLTVAWQLSEVSLLLKVKDGLSHPFKSFGWMIKGMLKGPNINVGREEENRCGSKENNGASSSVPFQVSEIPRVLPEMPHVRLSGLDFNSSEE